MEISSSLKLVVFVIGLRILILANFTFILITMDSIDMEAIVLLHSFRKVVLNKKDIVSIDKKSDVIKDYN